jgi:hypothetical protein
VDLKAKRVLIEQLARMMKHLAAMGTVRELDADTYSHTQLSEALTKPIYRDSVIFALVARQSSKTRD